MASVSNQRRKPVTIMTQTPQTAAQYSTFSM